VEQSLSPHTNHKRETTQTKKANKSKPPSVVCNFIAPHSHKERKALFKKNRYQSKNSKSKRSTTPKYGIIAR
jgi:guanylate kinase